MCADSNAIAPGRKAPARKGLWSADHCFVKVTRLLLPGTEGHPISGSLEEQATDEFWLPVIVELVATRDIAVVAVTVKGGLTTRVTKVKVTLLPLIAPPHDT